MKTSKFTEAQIIYALCQAEAGTKVAEVCRKMVLSEAKVTVTPMSERLRFAGTFELAGMDASINWRRVSFILKVVLSYLPEVDPAVISEADSWAGFRPCTPNGLPVRGRSKVGRTSPWQPGMP